MLICFGSPMLDIIANVTEDTLKKYEIPEDSAVRINEKNREIFDEILKFDTIILPGGSVTNTVRVFQWICNDFDRICFVGTIGQDDAGRIIKKQLELEKINCHLIEISKSTGRCAVLVTKKGTRSLVADLGASTDFSLENLDENVLESVEKATHLYISTFFISVSIDVMYKIIEDFLIKKKTIISNLGSCLLCQKYPKETEFLFKNSDIVVGNTKEFRTFFNLPKQGCENIQDILMKLNTKYTNKPERILLVTNGKNPINVLNGSTYFEHPVTPLKDEHIVDTNGAGDAFIGGFLAKFLENERLEKCIESGCYCSKIIVQNHGCSFENKKIYDD